MTQRDVIRCKRPGCMNEVFKTKSNRKRSSYFFSNYCTACNQRAYKIAKEFHCSKSTAKLLVGQSRKMFNRER